MLAMFTCFVISQGNPGWVLVGQTPLHAERNKRLGFPSWSLRHLWSVGFPTTAWCCGKSLSSFRVKTSQTEELPRKVNADLRKPFCFYNFRRFWIDFDSALTMNPQIWRGLSIFACLSSCANPFLYGYRTLRRNWRWNVKPSYSFMEMVNGRRACKVCTFHHFFCQSVLLCGFMK